MAKKVVCVLLSLMLIFPLNGCWSYHGLNEITIVSGVGIDRDEINGNYLLTCEVIDLNQSNKQSGIKSKIIESKGKTIFDAARNAKKKLINKLYWSNTQVVVIGNQLAKQEGVNAAIDWFISDAECRETIGVIISQEKSANEILSTQGLDSSVVSYEIKSIIDNDQKTTASIRNVPLFNVFNTLRKPGVSLTLPAFHRTNDKKTTVEANGEAVFKGNKMVGYLNPDEAKSYLFAVDGIRGGVLTLSSTNEMSDDVSLEISRNDTKRFYSFSEGKLTFTIQTDTDVYLDEAKPNTDLLDEQKISQIEKLAGDMLTTNITGVIHKMQTEYDSDIFGFGNMIYQKDPKLWEQVENKWDSLFQSMKVEVRCKVNILNTATMTKN